MVFLVVIGLFLLKKFLLFEDVVLLFVFWELVCLDVSSDFMFRFVLLLIIYLVIVLLNLLNVVFME